MKDLVSYGAGNIEVRMGMLGGTGLNYFEKRSVEKPLQLVDPLRSPLAINKVAGAKTNIHLNCILYFVHSAILFFNVQ